MSERCLMWHYVEDDGCTRLVPADEVFDTLAAVREWAEYRWAEYNRLPEAQHSRVTERDCAREVLTILNRSDSQ